MFMVKVYRVHLATFIYCEGCSFPLLNAAKLLSSVKSVSDPGAVISLDKSALGLMKSSILEDHVCQWGGWERDMNCALKQ